MFLDKTAVASIQDPGYQHFLSLILFVANKNANNLKYNVYSKFLHYLLRGAFVESKECSLAASLKLYQFYAHSKRGLRVALYLIPMSEANINIYPDSSASIDDFSYIVFYSLNKTDNRGMVLQEDLYSLFRQLRNLGELEDFVNDLERYKLTNS